MRTTSTETPCGYCSRVGATGADHLIPRAAGGLTVAENLYLACPRCNAILGDKIFDSLDGKRAYVRVELFRRGEWEGECPVCRGTLKAKNSRPVLLRQVPGGRVAADRAHALARLDESLAHALAQVQAIRERRIRPGTMPTEEVSGS